MSTEKVLPHMLQLNIDELSKQGYVVRWDVKSLQETGETRIFIVFKTDDDTSSYEKHYRLKNPSTVNRDKKRSSLHHSRDLPNPMDISAVNNKSEEPISEIHKIDMNTLGSQIEEFKERIEKFRDSISEGEDHDSQKKGPYKLTPINSLHRCDAKVDTDTGVSQALHGTRNKINFIHLYLNDNEDRQITEFCVRAKCNNCQKSLTMDDKAELCIDCEWLHCTGCLKSLALREYHENHDRESVKKISEICSEYKLDAKLLT